MRLPKPGAIPRPPEKPMNGERLWPTIAAAAARISSGNPPPATIATRTATIPLRTSSMPDTMAARGPRARRTFAPPVRPLPIVRGSGPPVTRAMTTPHGIPPIRYATTTTTAAIAIRPASIGREYSHRDSAGGGRLATRRPRGCEARLSAQGGDRLHEPIGPAAEPFPSGRVGEDLVEQRRQAPVNRRGAAQVLRRVR